MKINSTTVRKNINEFLKHGRTIEELIYDCHKVIRDLKEFPEENKNQIKYYEKFWNELLNFDK